MRRLLLLGTAAAALLASGCASVGPVSLPKTRSDYNVAIQRSSDQQLLLNLVRLRYRDTPVFLEVTSVSSQVSLETSASAAATLRDTNTAVAGSVTYEDRPTVTYAVLQGEEFVQRLLSPLSLDTVLLLYHSGWSIERVFRLIMQSMNEVPNAPSASGPTPDYPPRYERFLEVVHLLRELQRRGGLDLAYEAGSERAAMVARVDPRMVDDPQVLAIERLLGLTPGRSRYRVGIDVAGGGGDRVGVVTRSLLGVLFYLSQAVEVPPRHEAAGKVTVTRGAAGERFDWTALTGDLFRVRWSAERPADAAVAVSYRGTWFFVDDADLRSKSTFALLAQLFALQAGKSGLHGPVLTLPLGP
jgi:hypothetical protein